MAGASASTFGGQINASSAITLLPAMAKKLCKTNPSLEVVSHNLLHRLGWARKIGSQLSKRRRVMGMSCDLAAFPASSLSLRYIERVSIALGQ